MYTIEDLKNAEAQLDEVAERWLAAYSSSRPNPVDAEARAAAGIVREIEEDLKGRGVMEYTEQELIEESLDVAFPYAQSLEVVMFDGKRYRRRFHPLEKSESGKTVRKWGRTWEPLDESQ